MWGIINVFLKFLSHFYTTICKISNSSIIYMDTIEHFLTLHICYMTAVNFSAWEQVLLDTFFFHKDESKSGLLSCLISMRFKGKIEKIFKLISYTRHHQSVFVYNWSLYFNLYQPRPHKTWSKFRESRSCLAYRNLGIFLVIRSHNVPIKIQFKEKDVTKFSEFQNSISPPHLSNSCSFYYT